MSQIVYEIEQEDGTTISFLTSDINSLAQFKNSKRISLIRFTDKEYNAKVDKITEGWHYTQLQLEKFRRR